MTTEQILVPFLPQRVILQRLRLLRIAFRFSASIVLAFYHHREKLIKKNVENLAIRSMTERPLSEMPTETNKNSGDRQFYRFFDQKVEIFGLNLKNSLNIEKIQKIPIIGQNMSERCILCVPIRFIREIW